MLDESWAQSHSYSALIVWQMPHQLKEHVQISSTWIYYVVQYSTWFAWHTWDTIIQDTQLCQPTSSTSACPFKNLISKLTWASSSKGDSVLNTSLFATIDAWESTSWNGIRIIRYRCNWNNWATAGQRSVQTGAKSDNPASITVYPKLTEFHTRGQQGYWKHGQYPVQIQWPPEVTLTR